MYKVYLTIPGAIDEKLGHVNENGEVYSSKVGLDERLGRVDLSTGKIYTDRLGPDKKIGWVDLKNGKVYRSLFGPDEYVGRVDDASRFHQHVPLGVDKYIGKIDHFVSYAHSAGAMLLLVLPALEQEQSDQNQEGS